jgi:hypothetical protein
MRAKSMPSQDIEVVVVIAAAMVGDTTKRD